MFWFGCSRQQKHHAATPPPAGVWRRTERKRQKLVGQDKGSLTVQQTKGTGTTTIQIKGIHKTKQTAGRDALPDHCAHTWPTSQFPPPRSPSPEPSMTARGMEYPALFGQVKSARQGGCAPSWIPVKINPVLAEPRTACFFKIWNSLIFIFVCLVTIFIQVVLIGWWVIIVD